MQVNSINIKSGDIDGMINILKKGLPANAFDKLRERLNVSDNRLSEIVQIPKRTLSRRRIGGRLKTGESERVLRIARLYDKALDVFENESVVEKWLKKPARGLGYKVPLEYADTEIGTQEIINLLGRIEHGIFPG